MMEKNPHFLKYEAAEFTVERSVPFNDEDEIIINCRVEFTGNERTVTIEPREGERFLFRKSSPMKAQLVAEAIAEAARRAQRMYVTQGGEDK